MQSNSDYIPLKDDSDNDESRKKEGVVVEEAPLSRKDALGFFISGLCNNSGYVIMNAGAKQIDASMVGLIYICGEGPGLILKALAPYFAHKLSYRTRMNIICILMTLSFLLVAIGDIKGWTWIQLLGVCLGSASSSLGEVSYLALTSFYNSRQALTYWGAGTGFAGVFGYFWVISFTFFFGAPFYVCTLVAISIPVCYLINFNVILGAPKLKREEEEEDKDEKEVMPMAIANPRTLYTAEENGNPTPAHEHKHDAEAVPAKKEVIEAGTVQLTAKERFYLVLDLWPYMLPLFVVYFSEYAIQSGCWAAMGFPHDDADARAQFYAYANWSYQFGVLVSRSGGILYRATLKMLWIMPALQAGFLVFFTLDAFYKFYYDWSLIALCFVVGLLGGSVYVQGFSLLSERVEPHLKEFSLTSASLANNMGNLLGNVTGLLIQRAVYSYLNISDDDRG